MGLDGVEIVMKVEESFDIVIDDSEADKIVTPGQLIELILAKVGRTTHAACSTQRAFHCIRASLIRRSGFKRDQINPDTSLIRLFPRTVRKEIVRQVLADIDARKEMDFVRPNWLQYLISGATLFCAIGLAIFLSLHPVTSNLTLVNFLFESPIMAALTLLVSFGWTGVYVTRWARTEFRPSMTTVAHFSRWIVANAPDAVKAQPGQWSREQVSEIVRQIVIDMLGCEKQYREDANFVKDLGLS